MTKRVLSMAAALVLFALAAPPARPDSPSAANFHVAPTGDDGWSGRLPAPNADRTDGPFATLERARDALREARKAVDEPRPWRVLVRGGVYRMETPFVLEPEDSGAEGAPVVYAAAPGERPVFQGGRRIEGWRRDGGGPLWVADVPEAGTEDGYFHQLFVNGQRRPRARTPNDGYLTMAAPLPEIKNPKKHRGDGKGRLGFTYREGDLRRWNNPEDVNIVYFHSWTSSLHWIQALDEARRTVRFTSKSAWPIGWWKHERYFVENARELLDAPGEWYLDRAAGRLTYYPRPGESMKDAEVIAPVLTQLVRFDGRPEAGEFVDRVRLEGLTFHYADWRLPRDNSGDGQAHRSLPDAAVFLNGARRCALVGCEFGHLGHNAVWFKTGCRDCRLERCHVFDYGANGVRIGDQRLPGEAPLRTEGVVVDNCFVHDGGNVFHGGVGVIILKSSHNRVTHNEICDMDYSGVSVGWQWNYQPSTANHNEIGWNHIHHIGRGVLSDMGGVYTLGISPGTRVHHNHIHDVCSHDYGGWGLYTDQASTHIRMDHNLVHDTRTGGFHQHFGKENLIEHNIFAYSLGGQIIRSKPEEHSSFTFRHNLVYCDNEEVLSKHWGDGNFEIDRNVYWTTADNEPEFGGWTFEEWQAKGRDVHSLLAKPGFVDPEARDFRLRDGAPALEAGFEPFDAGECGLYGDPEWVALAKTVRREPSDCPPPPGPWLPADDFEDTRVGAPPRKGHVMGGASGASLAVTDETAAGGRRSLKFTDAAGQEHAWQPHLTYATKVRKGRIRWRFDLRVEPDTLFWTEMRDMTVRPYRIGPSLNVGKDGTLTANGKTLMTAPQGEWFSLAIEMTVGPAAQPAFDLAVGLPEGETRRFEGLSFAGDRRLERLRWLGFMSMNDGPGTFFIDNLRLEKLD